MTLLNMVQYTCKLAMILNGLAMKKGEVVIWLYRCDITRS